MADQIAPASQPAAQSVTDPAKVAAQGRAAVDKKAADATKKLIADTFNPPATPNVVGAVVTDPATAKPDEGRPAEAKSAEAKPSSLLDRKKPQVAPVETAVAPADLPETKLELPADAPEPQKKNFAELRKIANQLRVDATAKAKEIADLKKQLETHQAATPADLAEMSRLKDEHKAMSDRLAVVDLSNHPDFKRQFVEPRKAAIKEAADVLSYNGRESVDFPSLMAKPLKDFNAGVAELTKDMNSMDSTTVQAALRNAYRLQGEERAALATSSELAQGIVAKSAANHKQAFEETWGNLGEAGQFLMPVAAADDAPPEKKQSAADYNQNAAMVKAAAEKNVFGQLTERGAAMLGAKAAILDFLTTHGIPRVEERYGELVALNQQLTAELTALKGAKRTGAVIGDLNAEGASQPIPGKNSTERIHNLVSRTFGRQ